MTRFELIKKLVRIANALDTKGRTAEADELTRIASRIVKAQSDLENQVKNKVIDQIFPGAGEIIGLVDAWRRQGFDPPACGNCVPGGQLDSNCLKGTNGKQCTPSDIINNKCPGWQDKGEQYPGPDGRPHGGKTSPDGCWFIGSYGGGREGPGRRYMVFTGKPGCDCKKCCVKFTGGIGGGGGVGVTPPPTEKKECEGVTDPDKKRMCDKLCNGLPGLDWASIEGVLVKLCGADLISTKSIVERCRRGDDQACTQMKEMFKSCQNLKCKNPLYNQD